MNENHPGEIEQHVRNRAHDYFPQFGSSQVHVQLANKWQRNNSCLYRFALCAQGQARFVFVKVPTARGGSRSADRPYLIPETDPAIKFRMHYSALQAIHGHFARLQDPRFGSVRVLDLLPGSDAFVMEEAPGNILRKLLTKSSRMTPTFSTARLDRAFYNAGAWLRVYHELPRQDKETENIHQHRLDFVHAADKFTDFLARTVGDTIFFQQVAGNCAALANRLLPEFLPLGLRFGDFGLTNILVATDGRVTAIDTLARWRTPIYEDIAWLLTGLKAYNVQIFSQGLAFRPAMIARLEHQFLAGYFDSESIPTPTIRLYEVLRLLERWSAKVKRNGRRSAFLGKLSHDLANRFFRKKIRQQLEELDANTFFSPSAATAHF